MIISSEWYISTYHDFRSIYVHVFPLDFVHWNYWAHNNLKITVFFQLIDTSSSSHLSCVLMRSLFTYRLLAVWCNGGFEGGIPSPERRLRDDTPLDSLLHELSSKLCTLGPATCLLGNHMIMYFLWARNNTPLFSTYDLWQVNFSGVKFIITAEWITSISPYQPS